MEATGRCHAGRAREDFGGGCGWAVGRGVGSEGGDSCIGFLDEGAGWFDGDWERNRHGLGESGGQDAVD